MVSPVHYSAMSMPENSKLMGSNFFSISPDGISTENDSRHLWKVIARSNEEPEFSCNPEGIWNCSVSVVVLK